MFARTELQSNGDQGWEARREEDWNIFVRKSSAEASFSSMSYQSMRNSDKS